MPGRQSHGGAPSTKPKGRVNNKKRSLNAFAIAAQENPENPKIRQHRLGESEGGNRSRKRAREDGDAGGDEDASSLKKKKKSAARARPGELDADVGSDSEGNEWRMGEVDSDNDSDIDSDEAFGESDEDKFDGFAFSGSSKGKAQKRCKDKGKSITLDEDIEILDDSEDDSFGGDAIDLAAMMDTVKDGNVGGAPGEDEDYCSDERSVGSSEDSDRDSSFSSEEGNDVNDPDKMAALQELIVNLPQADSSTQSIFRQRNDGTSEHRTPSDFGVTPKAKLTLEDFSLPLVKDPFVKKSLKLLAADSKSATKGSGVSRKLEVPLPKRQQDRLDRGAAYDKTKETLDRWTDTVKHNRRAEHLIFPLLDPDAASLKANSVLQPTSASKPFNELEATIQSILEESGLAASNGKDAEDKLIEFKELATNKPSTEEVKASRNQLRKARELLFREEVRAKRIKKIKSKSYRRVHRKEREKEDRVNKEALIEAGVQMSEEEQELQDRRRAEERVGARHRGSKWAKATKQTGQATWDEDARAGITEMAKRGEELRRRVEGKSSRKDDISDSESSLSESGEGESDDEVLKAKYLRKLESTSHTNSFSEARPGSRLPTMKFMLKAEASRKKANDEMVKQIRKELAGEVISEEDGPDVVGRRTFGAGSEANKGNELPKIRKGSEFEEAETEASGDDDVKITTQSQELDVSNTSASAKISQSSQRVGQPKGLPGSTTLSEGGAWSHPSGQMDAIRNSEARYKKQRNSAIGIEELDLSSTTVIARQVQIQKKPEIKSRPLLISGSNEDEGEEDDVNRLPFAIKDQELIKRAFAGADVVGEFEAEKRQTVVDEGDKVVDNTLPGWGSWVGEGLTKKEKQKNKGRFLTKVKGIKEQNRKDAKLERVIINEKQVKKNGKYLASTLPHPYETRQQYERSLRLPVGPEWTTKDTFQDATKPRILVKQGIIAPMSKPLL